MKTLMNIFILLLFSTSVFAAQGPNWNYIEGSYYSADIDHTDEDPDGFGATGSVLLGTDFLLMANYSMLSEEVADLDIDFDFGSIGFGMRYPASPSTDIFGIVSYEYVKFDIEDFGDEDENGYGIRIGARSMLTDAIELTGTVGYVDIDDSDETSFGVSAYYHFTEMIGIGVGYEVADDVDLISGSLRFSF